ncbi:MAG TPA: tRNA (adenosine(37)-N6)-threonylcarbamoyltransferase complex ATPase subunit type 1 TsaE [Patescibacteria group bacterium]|jgi:tRNA threonylcarbamoyladenosine biosynthesis protein TsaE|nr:tRNA (adenosine(37)-N6)-threonylcarbamoyltransferase complex ATPase subunit type 1 TsaE [Patescibacteria group bacterium]
MKALAPKTKPKIELPLSQVTAAAQKIAKTIKGGEVLALIGELGSGKTTFTKALGAALGIKQTISSPTFVMMQEFEIPAQRGASTKTAKKFLYHLDLYRTKNFNEVKSLGITEWWGRPETVTVIEWADKILKDLPANATIIYLHRDQK